MYEGTNIPKSWESAILEAEDIYTMFHHFEPDSLMELSSFHWPTLQGIAGRATKIGYKSDKFEGVWTDYTHKFKGPRPKLTRQYVIGDRLRKRPIPAPKPPVLPYLGFVLDIEFFDLSRRRHHWSWLHFQNQPLLAWWPQKRCLVVQDQAGGFPILLDSKILDVTERGIIN